MKKVLNKIHSGIVAALTTVIISMPALAEDIEIYQDSNQGASTVKPNIMFILDTSGSMATTLDVDANYDPDHDYSDDANNCFDSTRIYPSITSDVACTDTFKNNYYQLSQNKCDRATEAFSVTGMYNSTYAQWNVTNNYWGQLKERDNADYIIDCQPDQGIHGDGGLETYINVSGTTSAYTTNATDSELSWGSIERDTNTMYTGNWMNYKVSVGTVNITRSEVMTNVITNMIYSMDGVNVGLMNFNYYEGGRVRFPVVDITDNRAAMKTELDSWSREMYTPLSETLYEAYLYFTGGNVTYGDTYADVEARRSVDDSRITDSDPSRYKSPVDADFAGCQKQFIIYLSDGAPTKDISADDEIQGLDGFVSTTGSTTDCSGSDDGACLDDLAGYMNRSQGLDVLLPDGTTVSEVKVNTYTVGFGSDITILQDTAREGGGEYFIAYDATQLLTTLTSIISSIRDTHTTFSSPAVSVNAFNRTTHRSELYFTLFKPEVTPHWDGNFKRFKLAFDDQGIPEILDSNDKLAVSNLTGFFKDDALSYWTSTDDAPDGDGGNTSIGGAASELFTSDVKADARKVYSNINADNSVLSDSSNRIWDDTDLLKEKMGMPTGTTDTVVIDYYNKLVDWLRGVDVNDDDGDDNTTDARRILGDPLHAQPALIQYGGTDDNPDITSYVATNDGLLHAFSTETGIEQFAFIPQELLPDMNKLFLNTSTKKYYGLDGTVVPYIIDTNVDGVINPLEDKAYIFFGMRRGGSNYYALDVTDRDNPELMWTIKGGVDSSGDAIDSTLGDYSHLGQTWSKPTLRIIRLNGADVPVLIFAAGYDTNQDSVLVRTADSIGRGIYIINALTGAPLWRMGPDSNADLTDSNMIYSMPSDVSAVDTNGDGYVDHLYVGDMGGQIWRIDIDNGAGNTASSLSTVTTGGRIADFADSSVASNRRFYYPPSVAIGANIDDSTYTALVLSSGYRAHPLDRDIQDKIFMLRDLPVNGKPLNYETQYVNDTTTDLYDATENLIGQGTDTEVVSASDSLANSNGWFIDLDKDAAEKGLTKALIFSGEIFLTTYVPFDPRDTTLLSCEPNEGTGHLYHLNLYDATPVKNYDTIISSDPDALTVEDRIVDLTRGGIPADPTVITTDEGSARCVGTECDRLDGTGLHKTIYWFEK